MGNSSDRLRETVKAEALLWGAETAQTYHGTAASHMDAQWEAIISPILAQYPIDYRKTIDFVAGFGRNTRKLLEAGAEHVTDGMNFFPGPLNSLMIGRRRRDAKLLLRPSF